MIGDASREKLRRLASHRFALEHDFAFGEWEGGNELPDGSIQMPWYGLSAEAEALFRDLARAGWIEPFDWPAWVRTARGAQLMADPVAIGDASANELGQLLTSLVREERIADGTLVHAFESGMLAAIARRAETLAAALDDEDAR
jgi:hypothetical protein